jgi:anti-sigma regulatory factor (Ser/Thr protein kinase)
MRSRKRAMTPRCLWLTSPNEESSQRVMDPRLSPGACAADLGRYPVRTLMDAHGARRAVRLHAAVLGFGRVPCEELTIVASELCTNIAKYGVRGVLVVQQLLHPVHGPALVLDARDQGPVFQNFALAVRDRSDDRGTIPPERLHGRAGIGAGLGAVQRLTHLLWTEPSAEGKSVVALRYLTAPSARR